MKSPKRILIDARLRDGEAGGIQQVVVGLAQGFSQIKSEGFDVRFLCYKGHEAWLQPYLGNNQGLFRLAKRPTPTAKPSALKASVRRMLRNTLGLLPGTGCLNVPAEPVEVREFNPHLIHFVHQNIFKTQRPFIFTPHDLQHEHFPEYFDQRTRLVRRELYKKHSQNASMVACISESCRDDVVRYLGIDEGKCPVIHNAPPTAGYGVSSEEELKRLVDKFSLPDKFFFFPAKTYPHKNHIRLLEAIELLKKEDVRVNVVCSGPLTEFYHERILPEIVRLDVADQIHFLGWLEPDEVNALYQLAHAMVFPSLFEGFGIPLVEAMGSGLPLICSDVSCIPEIVGSCGLFFDPKSPRAIADALKRIVFDNDLAEELSRAGLEEGKKFSWPNSSEKYLAVYQSVLS